MSQELKKAASEALHLKPLLRGWSHAVASVAAIPLAIGLAMRSAHDPARMASLLVYGVGAIQLYAVSAVYHLGSWKGRSRRILLALDHTNIFFMIAATYTPISVIVLAGPLRLIVLIVIWLQAALGALLTVLLLTTSRWKKTILYMSMGIIGLILLGNLLGKLPPAAISLLIAGSALYIFGGVVFALRRPDPMPRIFGYHEIFHALVICAGAAFAALIWFWVVPFA